MKTIAIVMCVNNPEMFTQEDLELYQTKNCYYRLYYTDTPLKELNTNDDVQTVLPLTVQTIQKAEQGGAAAALVYAFGDVGIIEAKQSVAIPVMGMGKPSVSLASEICRNRFTILPGVIRHNDFILDMVKDMGLEKKFQLAEHEIGLLPSEVRTDPDVMNKLFSAACAEIDKHNTDTFTMGCTCFMGLAMPLQEKLRDHYQDKKISVVDPGEVALAIAKLF